MIVRAATRASALARWQTDHVAELLAAVTAGRDGAADVLVEPVLVDTTADRRLDIPIWELGGKGVFVKEVQAEVLAGRARIAVHSGKDLPAVTHADLVIAAVPGRGDPRDVLVGATLATLATGAVVATGSVRRRAQLANLRTDLSFVGLRGNISTRLAKIPAGGAIVMAAAALDRLRLYEQLDGSATAYEILEPSMLVPQVAQGTLAVECRGDDHEMVELLQRIDHGSSRRSFETERAFLAELGGDCDLPAGAFAVTVADTSEPARADPTIEVSALLASLDGHVILRVARSGGDPDRVGRAVARELLDDCGGSGLLAT